MEAMKVLFLHGWHSTPGGVKPVYRSDHGHDVLNPALPDDMDFDAAVAIAQAEFDREKPDVVVGSSRGGAVAMNIETGRTPLVLLCPAWKRWGTVTKVKRGTVILHSKADDVVPFADSAELVRNSGLPSGSLVEVGTEHRLADEDSLAKMLEVVETQFGLAMLEATATASSLRPPLVTPDFGVPRRFGIGTMLVVTAMYAMLFAVLRAIGLSPLDFGVIVLFFTAVGLGQAILFGGKRPRVASRIVGASFSLSVGLVRFFHREMTSGVSIPLHYLCIGILFSLFFGLLWGYVAGVLISGVFLMLDKLGRLRGKAKNER